MRAEIYAITCLIRRRDGFYYTGSGWEADMGDACLFAAPRQAEEALKDQGMNGDAAIWCVIQNKFFDYYDGGKFVYNLHGAKLYSFQDAAVELGRLNLARP